MRVCETQRGGQESRVSRASPSSVCVVRCRSLSGVCVCVLPVACGLRDAELRCTDCASGIARRVECLSCALSCILACFCLQDSSRSRSMPSALHTTAQVGADLRTSHSNLVAARLTPSVLCSRALATACLEWSARRFVVVSLSHHMARSVLCAWSGVRPPRECGREYGAEGGAVPDDDSHTLPRTRRARARGGDQQCAVTNESSADFVRHLCAQAGETHMNSAVMSGEQLHQSAYHELIVTVPQCHSR